MPVKSANALLLDAIRSRQLKGGIKSPFNQGILTADRYATTLEQCVGSDLCYRYGSKANVSFNDAVKRAAGVLAYNNEEMVVEETYHGVTKDHNSFDDLHGVELPKNTLMVFKNVLTTPRKDRDGDILRTQGATVDPKMLLLWQHVHTLPIGKMLKVHEHNSKKLVTITALVDLNELAHDAAVMIDNGMGRFSHGFRALSFSQMKEVQGDTTSGGFDVKTFEILEQSLVSVPANPDAETVEVMLDLIEGDKLTSSIMKSFGKRLRNDQKTKTVAGGLPEHLKEKDSGNGCGCGKSAEDCGCGKPDDKSPEETHAGSDNPDTHKGTAAEDTEVGKCPTCKVELGDDGICGECGWFEGQESSEEMPKKKDYTANVSSPTIYGPLEGSWEEIQHDLQSTLKDYMVAAKIMKEKVEGKYNDQYVRVLSTTQGKALVKFEDYGSENAITKYFEIAWSKITGSPAAWVGDPVEMVVEIEVRVAKAEKLFEALQKGRLPGRQKAGRVLSKTNVDKLTDVHEDLKEIHEHCSTRSGKALTTKCQGTVKEVLDGATIDDFDTNDGKSAGSAVDVKSAVAIIIEKATVEQRDRLLDVLSVMKQVAQTSKTAKILQAIKG